MIKVGKILIDPNSIDTILCLDPKFSAPNEERGIHKIQIIYKSGVVKNTTSSEIGMGYNDFVNKIIEQSKHAEDTKILRIMAAINQQKQ